MFSANAKLGEIFEEAKLGRKEIFERIVVIANVGNHHNPLKSKDVTSERFCDISEVFSSLENKGCREVVLVDASEEHTGIEVASIDFFEGCCSKCSAFGLFFDCHISVVPDFISNGFYNANAFVFSSSIIF